MKKLNKKGFTLAELLIVVAIIAVLVAIAIPVFGAALEKAREATDAANLRAAYAEVMVDVVAGEGSVSKTVTQKQTEAGWTTSVSWPENFNPIKAPTTAGTTWTVSWNASTDKVEAN